MDLLDKSAVCVFSHNILGRLHRIILKKIHTGQIMIFIYLIFLINTKFSISIPSYTFINTGSNPGFFLNIWPTSFCLYGNTFSKVVSWFDTFNLAVLLNCLKTDLFMPLTSNFLKFSSSNSEEYMCKKGSCSASTLHILIKNDSNFGIFH